MGREPFPITGSLDDKLVAGVGESVQGDVAKDGVVEEAEPLLHGPVACDDDSSPRTAWSSPDACELPAS